MSKSSSGSKLPPLAAFVRRYLRSGLRGASRLTYLLARNFKSLQQVPIELPGWKPVYIDLRMGNSHLLLMDAPYAGLWREMNEVSVMQRFVRSGDVVFDIGANIGLHSILLSHLVGERGSLHAFEPNTELVPALTRTLSDLGNATLHTIALSDKDDESTLFVPPDDSMASLKDWTADNALGGEGEPRLVTCQQRRMDDLVREGILPQPDFIKCDVEGAELLVFQGGQETLEREDAPLILFEVNKDASQGFGYGVSSAKDFLAELKSPRYEFFKVQAGGELTRLEAANSFMNVLAVPESKIQWWPELRELVEAGSATTAAASSDSMARPAKF
jgi:FkbM family methyltransferase